jgi:TM2 domain-containing membrane protein YozV
MAQTFAAPSTLRPAFDLGLHGIYGGQNITGAIVLHILWSLSVTIIPSMRRTCLFEMIVGVLTTCHTQHT